MKKCLRYAALLLSLLSLNCGREKRNYRIGALGDSITRGSEQANYPSELKALIPDKDSVTNYGVAGTCLVKDCFAPIWNTSAFSALLKDKPDIILVMLGTNDVHFKNYGVRQNFEMDYREMIDLFQEMDSEPRIVLCYPPPFYENSPVGDSLVRTELIPIIDKIAADYHLEVVDTHFKVDDYPAHYPDKLHPDREGAHTLATIVAETLDL